MKISMDFPIDILNQGLIQHNEAYNKYVTNGVVDANNPVAIQNRQRAEELEQAIKVLKAEAKKNNVKPK